MKMKSLFIASYHCSVVNAFNIFPPNQILFFPGSMFLFSLGGVRELSSNNTQWQSLMPTNAMDI